MPALNPEIIKDTKSLISFYQKNPRFKTAFDRIVANNINATYKGRPVKLYVEILKTVTSKYKQEYSQVRKIVLHDTDGKVGELFGKVDPYKDFNRLDEAYEAALKGKNITDFKNDEKNKEIDKINEIEEKTKDNIKEKRQAYERREEEIKAQEEKPIIPGESPENKKSYNPASQEERDRLKVALLPKDEVPTPTEIRQEPGGYSLPSTSLPNIPNPSRLRNFASGSKTFLRGGVKAGGVIAKGAGRAAGTAIKAGAGAAAKLVASAALGAATGGVGFVVMLAISFGGDFVKLIKWIVIILFATILLFFVFQRGMKMNSLLPPYDVPTMGHIGAPGLCPTQAFIDQNRKTSPETCQYLNPPINIFGDLTTAQINAYIKKYWQQSGLNESQFTAKTNLIVERARVSGLNPVIFLGYWKSESAFKEGFGCQNTPLNFNSQLECAVGLTAGASRVIQCASPKSPYREQGCQDIKSIIMAHPDIYDKSLFSFDFSKTSFSLAEEPNPIRTFDAIAEGHGPKSPNLSLLEGVTNNNCIHTYNDLLEVILTTGACTQPPTPSGSFNSYFCQSNPSWASLPISNSGDTMSSGGCGLTSLAMLLNYFGLPYTPTEVLAKFNQNPSWYTYAGGTNIYSALEWVKSLGFEVVDLSPDVLDLSRDIPKYLNDGYLILGSQYINSPLSHIFIVSKSLPNGNVILQDPDKTCQPNLEKTITGVMNDYSNPTYGKWIYAKAIKKVR